MDASKWEAILAEAGQAFGRFGFRKTSMDDIARAAGVAKGTLYLGCTSKRDLFYQTILRDLRLWNAELARPIDPRVPADELLVRVAAEALRTQHQFPLARRLILGEFDADLPDLADHFDELRAHGETTIHEILRIGARQGRFRADLDLEQAAGVLLDLITATIMFHGRGPEADARVLRRAEVAFDLVLNGLLTPAAASARSA